MTDSTAVKHERPSLDDAYGDLTYNDDQAIEKAFGVVVDELFERLNDGGATYRDMLAIVSCLELARRLHDGMAFDTAAIEVKALPKRLIVELLDAYMDHADEPVPSMPVTPEGKDDSVSE